MGFVVGYSVSTSGESGDLNEGGTMIGQGQLEVGMEYISVLDVDLKKNVHVVFSCKPEGCIVMPGDDGDTVIDPYQMRVLADWLLHHAKCYE